MNDLDNKRLRRDIWDLAVGRLTPDGAQRLKAAFADPNSGVWKFLDSPWCQAQDVLVPQGSDFEEDWTASIESPKDDDRTQEQPGRKSE